MSRRVIISILVILIVGIIGGTAILIMNRLRGTSSSSTAQQSPGSLQEAETGGQQVVDPTGDSDNDGLNNADERIWGTDANNADSDGDGFLDGQEVTAGHNPSIAGPNDLLPPGFQPGQDVNPLEVAATQPIAVDQLFAENLDLSGPKGNLTELYNQKYPEGQRTDETLDDFALEQAIITKLPTPTKQAIDLLADNTPGTVEEYLKVAGNIDVFRDEFLLDEALNNLFENGDSSMMRGLALGVRIHQEALIKTKVPPAAENFHKLLLGYSALVAATYDQIARYNEDPVRTWVALRQLEENDATYYPILANELNRL